jgi:hypothetical protein
MQNHKWLWWVTTRCIICDAEVFYIEGHDTPKTCSNQECIKKHHLKGIEKYLQTT